MFAFAYVAICIVLWAGQESLIYAPIDDTVGDWTFCEQNSSACQVSFQSEDGTQLVGCFLKKENATGNVLLFHGAKENIGTVTDEISILSRELNANVFVFDYRGFGKSGGFPSERGLIEDGHAAMRTLNELSDTEPRDVVVIGRSLGGGPASRTAIDMDAKALVLHSTYAALDELCARKVPVIPVSLLLRTRFRTIDWIDQFEGPVLFAHGTEDQLIPTDNSQRLFQKSKSQFKQFFQQEACGHFDALNGEYINELKSFLNDLNAAEDQGPHWQQALSEN